MISAVNHAMHKTLNFKQDDRGHYAASISYECLMHYEQDYIAAIFDVMDQMGYAFKFEYDSRFKIPRFANDDETNQMTFIFQKISVTQRALEQATLDVEC